jgi:hypothetical protein
MACEFIQNFFSHDRYHDYPSRIANDMTESNNQIRIEDITTGRYHHLPAAILILNFVTGIILDL